MANFRRKGKYLFLSLLSFCLFVSDLLIFSPRLSCSVVLASQLDPSSNSNVEIAKDHENENPFEKKTDLVNNRDLVFLEEMEKLQELVQNLTRLVSRLEARFTECPFKAEDSPLPSSSHEETKNLEKTKQETTISTKDENLPAEGLKRGAKDARGTVFKYNTFWSEKFQFLSAVKLRFSPTFLNVLPYKDHDGLSKYFAVGDNNGKLLIFLKNGDVTLELDSLADPTEYSPVTAIVSALSVFKNETLIATGHDNGIIVIHRVWEPSGSGDDWNSLRFERLGRFETPGGSRINLLEAHQMGRKRYIIASDNGGALRVLGEDGSLYGSINPGRQPLAFLRQRLMFLTETGAGSLDLRNMRLKETECEGLNNSFVRNYVFDVVDRTKAYGFTSEGDLVHTLLLGDATNFKCRVRSKRRLNMDHPVALQAIRGYLLLTNKDKAYVYNVSTQHYVRAGGPRHVFSVGLDEILSSFPNPQAVDLENDEEEEEEMAGPPMPLVASDYEKIVVLSLGDGYVAMYRSNLPVFKNEFNSILWTSPVLFFILFLFVVWHFFANKKDALTSWGPDDPFVSSGSTGPASGPGPSERPFAESSGSSGEIIDVRGGGGLRGPPRYGSPAQYTSGIGSLAGSYMVSGDVDPRHGQMDPRFRSELKYRVGPHVEGGTVMKRRDAFYVNSQAVDER